MCRRIEIDTQQMMDWFCGGSKVNLSPYHLKPGFAAGSLTLSI
jgi:GDP-mannose 6-dehydrogenase